MCGIAGFFDSLQVNRGHFQTGRSMRGALAHRGPDGIGEQYGPNFYLGHTRLSILDLSEAGNQPFIHPNGNVTAIFNGEIYNHRSLRSTFQSEGITLRTQTDGEVIPFLIDKWREKFVHQLKGMFAIAAYQKTENKFYLARDRMGIKPLYYAWQDGILYFGSEIKALLQVSELEREVDFQAIYDFLSLGYVPEPATGFAGISALEPGTMLVCEKGELRKIRYHEHKINHGESSSVGTQEDFENLFRESVSSHLMSDVPLGAFLSGGIDSSSIVVAASQAGHTLPTFCAKFSDKQFDESRFAQIVASSMNTVHHELNFPEGVGNADVLWKLISHFDQPFGDSSLLPTFMISSEIRKHVKVALSGDGGDEILTGYTIFRDFPRIYNLKRLPAGLRRILLNLAKRKLFSDDFSRRLEKAMSWTFLDYPAISSKLQSWISEEEKPGLIGGDFARFSESKLLPIERLWETSWTESDFKKNHGLLRSELTAWMLKYSLPGDMLKKVDMMSMLAGIEVRVPLLADDLVAFSLAEPMNAKTNGRLGKLPLRKFLEGRVPNDILTKQKWGFAIPLDTYASKGMLELIRSKLLGPNSHCRTYFDSSQIEWTINQFEGKSVDRSKISRQGVYQRILMMMSLEAFFEKVAAPTENEQLKVSNASCLK